MSLPRVADVYLDRAGDPVKVGTLRPSYAGGRNLASASFQYERSFVEDPHSYPISPDLPLTESRIYTPENASIFGAFADASPDQWGQKLIEANHARLLKENPTLPRKIGAFDFLLGVSDYTRMGALRFREPETKEWLSNDSQVASLHELDKVMSVARRYEEHRATDDDVAYLSDIATSPGGARPKANVLTANGRLAIAKLPHSKDGDVDVEAWEAVVLVIANALRIQTPTFQVHRASPQKTVLISERFDRGPGGERRGYISAATALGVGSNDDRRITYEEFSDTIAELSSDPAADLREMFRRIALTVLVNNVDDHWRNHGFLRVTSGWRLAPMFDVNPSRSHRVHSRAISDRDDPADRDIANLLDTASSYKLSPSEGARLIREVAVEVTAWRRRAQTEGIPESQISAMAQAFDESQLARARDLSD